MLLLLLLLLSLLLLLLLYMIINLHFTSRKIQTKKDRQTKLDDC